METKKKLFRITTVPISLKTLLKGQLKYMSQHFEVVGISSKGRELDDVVIDEEIQVISIEMTRKMTPLKDLISLFMMIRILRKERPEIVHTHTPKAGIIGMVGARLAGVPIRLHTVAGLPLMEAKGIKRKILDFVEKLTYNAATKVYPNSKGLYHFILENKYIDRSKLKVIGKGSSNGINTAHFSRDQISIDQTDPLKMQLGLQPDDFVFIFVGRLVGDKGVNELIQAFKSLSIKLESSKKIKLILVGSLEADLDPLATDSLDEIENNGNIIAVGFQSDVRPYYVISDALVFPSYREGFPNVVMQAGAMELPVIVSDINGCNEIVIEGKNGTIIPVKSADGIEIAMRSFIEDRAYFTCLKQNARAMILDRYEQHIVWEALLTEYKELLRDRGLNQ